MEEKVVWHGLGIKDQSCGPSEPRQTHEVDKIINFLDSPFGLENNEGVEEVQVIQVKAKEVHNFVRTSSP